MHSSSAVSLGLRHHKVAESGLMQLLTTTPGVADCVNIFPLFLGLKGMFNQIPAEGKLFDIKLCLIFLIAKIGLLWSLRYYIRLTIHCKLAIMCIQISV